MASQQFWYQRSLDRGCFGRQLILFCERPLGILGQKFADQCGVEPLEFLRQTAAYAAGVGAILNDERMVQLLPNDDLIANEDAFATVGKQFVTDIPTLVEKFGRFRNVPLSSEICEQTEMIMRPIIMLGKTPVVIHYQLLFRAVETALYDRLRELGSNDFGNVFGDLFEPYVGDVLRHLPARVYNADELEPLLQTLQGGSQDEKRVDFAVDTGDALILVEVKGGQGHYNAMYSADPDVVAEAMKKGEMKAVIQGVNTYQRLPAQLRRAATYVLCVTFKQHNVFRGNRLKEFTHTWPKWAEFESASRPAWEHFFFVSIDELERVVAKCNCAQVSLSDLLRNAVETDATFLEAYFEGMPQAEKAWPDATIEATSRLLGHNGTS
jgi:hypothetical protein